MMEPTIPEGPVLDATRRKDGSWVCFIDTDDSVPCDDKALLLTVYINNDPDPVYDYRGRHD